jgi:hypothetical protein
MTDEIFTPSGYANSAEGASAPECAPRRWQCGHLVTEHTHRDAATACFKSQGKVAYSALLAAADICSQAATLVGGDRAVTHGDKLITFANTAELWNAILYAKWRRDGGVPPRLDALDVANMLEAFKIARRYSGTHNIDDYIDGAGYAGCAGEIAAKIKG